MNKGTLLRVQELLDALTDDNKIFDTKDTKPLAKELNELIASVPEKLTYALKNYTLDEELPFIAMKTDKSMQYSSAYAMIDACKLLSDAVTEGE